MNAANYDGSIVVRFALAKRWIVTVECERHFVKVRHSTRWYAVARRIGYEDRRHWCASRADALGIAEIQREGFAEVAAVEDDPAFQQFTAWFKQQSLARQTELRNGIAIPISI